VRGLPAAGTPALKNFVPATDAPVVARLRALAPLCWSKTNMHELAFGVTGYNPAFHSGANIGVRNAYDQHRIAGGSSSGNGATLGARMVAAALSTGRAARCASLRLQWLHRAAPFRRTLSAARHRADLAHPRHRRPLALSVADLVLLDRAITGGSAVKPVHSSACDWAAAAPFFAHQDADTRAATDAALARLRAAGVTLVDVQMPRLMELNGAVGFRSHSTKPTTTWRPTWRNTTPASTCNNWLRASPARCESHVRRPGAAAQTASSPRGRRCKTRL
jgi:mandelamide amidase